MQNYEDPKSLNTLASSDRQPGNVKELPNDEEPRGAFLERRQEERCFLTTRNQEERF